MIKKIVISLFSIAAIVMLSTRALALENPNYMAWENARQTLGTTDSTLYQRVRQTMGLDTSGIAITTNNGVVRLSGEVSTLQEKEYALSAARNTPGVARVEDDIIIRNRR